METLELDHRENDGLVVSLLWRRSGNIVTVVASDARTGEELRLVVPPARARDAFLHPYAYAA